MFSSLNSIQSFKNSGVALPSWPSVTPSLTTLGTVGSGSYTYAATNRICASTDFTYIFQCSASGRLRSTNRGSSWSTITFSTSSNNTTCACSSTGQYVVFCSITSGKINYSNDYGASFSVLSTVTNIPASNFSPWSCNISDDGQYILIGRTNGASLSTDAGASWTILEASDFTFGCDMDSTGQYMVYGRWSSTALKVFTSLNISNCCVSRDGQRILLSNSATLYMIDFGQSI
jgi:hypothetical protein